MTRQSRSESISRPLGGWFRPWDNVWELAEALPTTHWTLVGGLMVQAHALAHGIDVIRPTEDLDILLHVEISKGVVSMADRAINGLGYSLQEPLDARGLTSPHYRYIRLSRTGSETIDLLVPDHASPISLSRLRGRPMFEVEGGTQALGRTMTYRIDTEDGRCVTLSVPDELGALVLKGAAYSVDRRDRERHLMDAAALAACISDHAAEIERLRGSDGRRIRALAKALADPTHPAWLAMKPADRVAGQDTLRILSAGPV